MNWSGWCLLFVQSAFGVGWSGSSAWDAWSSRVSFKHEDRDIPSGVFVPIWFDGYDNGQRLGHAAIYKDGQVYSSPYYKASHNVLLGSIEEVERIYGMSYVGWSEDIANVRVIEGEEEMSLIDEFTCRWVIEQTVGRAPQQHELDSRVGKLSIDYVINEWINCPEAVEYRAKRENDIKDLVRRASSITVATNDDSKKLKDLTDALKALGI